MCCGPLDPPSLSQLRRSVQSLSDFVARVGVPRCGSIWFQQRTHVVRTSRRQRSPEIAILCFILMKAMAYVTAIRSRAPARCTARSHGPLRYETTMASSSLQITDNTSCSYHRAAKCRDHAAGLHAAGDTRSTEHRRGSSDRSLARWPALHPAAGSHGGRASVSTASSSQQDTRAGALNCRDNHQHH